MTPFATGRKKGEEKHPTNLKLRYVVYPYECTYGKKQFFWFQNSYRFDGPPKTKNVIVSSFCELAMLFFCWKEVVTPKDSGFYWMSVGKGKKSLTAGDKLVKFWKIVNRKLFHSFTSNLKQLVGLILVGKTRRDHRIDVRMQISRKDVDRWKSPMIICSKIIERTWL